MASKGTEKLRVTLLSLVDPEDPFRFFEKVTVHCGLTVGG